MAEKRIAHFNLFGIIGEQDPYFEAFVGVEDPAFSAKKISEWIISNADADELVIHINSRGGSVDEGFAIHDLLINAGKKITTRIEGQAYSIASVVALAGSVRQITENSKVGIHNPWIDPWQLAFMYPSLEADDLQLLADDLRAENERVADFYVAKTGGDRDTIIELMNADTAMDADKALELKFITEIVKPQAQTANARRAVFFFNFKKSKLEFKNLNTENMNALKKEFNALATKFKNLAAGKGFTLVALDVTTSDGRTLQATDDDADGLVSVGDKITDADGNAVVGDTTLADGSTITTDDAGVVTEVKAAATDNGNDGANNQAPPAGDGSQPPTGTASAEALAAKEAEIVELKKQNETLSATVASYAKIESEIRAEISALSKLIKSDAQPTQGSQGFDRNGSGGKVKLTAEQTYQEIQKRNAKNATPVN